MPGPVPERLPACSDRLLAAACSCEIVPERRLVAMLFLACSLDHSLACLSACPRACCADYFSPKERVWASLPLLGKARSFCAAVATGWFRLPGLLLVPAPPAAQLCPTPGALLLPIYWSVLCPAACPNPSVHPPFALLPTSPCLQPTRCLWLAAAMVLSGLTRLSGTTGTSA